MPARPLHRFALEGKRYVIDPETCFCFECDDITWDVLAHYPEAPVNHVNHLLEGKYPRKELDEVIGELEWLRASKSILSPPKLEQQIKAFDLDRGLRRVQVRLGIEPLPARALSDASDPKAGARGLLSLTQWGRAARASGATGRAEATTATLPAAALRVQRAAALLLARGPQDATLRLDLHWEGDLTATAPVLEVLREAFTLATLAGKTLHVGLGTRVDGSGGLAGNTVIYTLVCTRADLLASALEALELAASGPKLAAKTFSGLADGLSGEVTLEPHGPAFATAVETLHGAGITVIDLNLDSPYRAEKPAAPEAVAEELRRCARYYAQALLKGDYFRLEPIAGLFHRIYLGEPMPRTDPAGLWSLAVDTHNGIYPSTALFGDATHRLGDVLSGELLPARLKRYEDTGSVTTPACYACWARNLCGGGSAAIHDALTGDFHTPAEPWCNAQRAWLETAIAAFNVLSAEGTNFARLYGQLGKPAKLSLFSLVRAAFQMNIGLRPLGEADAELLTRWQNFNDAAYFTFNETGLLMATKYDREMDAVHPKGHEFEFLLLRKTGAPMGLLKLRPLPAPESAMAWIYFRKPADYADELVRKSFRFLLGEAGKQQGLKFLSVPCGPFDTGLADFLAATGFTPAGAQREALYLRGTYHEVAWYGATLGS